MMDNNDIGEDEKKREPTSTIIDKEMEEIFYLVCVAMKKIRKRQENNTDTNDTTTVDVAITGQRAMIYILAYSLEYVTRKAKARFGFDEGTINEVIDNARYGLDLDYAKENGSKLPTEHMVDDFNGSMYSKAEKKIQEIQSSIPPAKDNHLL